MKYLEGFMKGLSPPYLDHRNGIEASTYVRRKYFGIDFLALSRQNQAMRFPYRARRLPHVSLLVVCGLAAIGLPLLVDLGLQGFLEPIELWSVDVRFRLRATPPVLGDSPAGKSKKLVIIDYDDLAAQEHGLGRWPWNRRVHAGLIDRLREAGAGGVVVDLLFTYPTKDPGEDQALVQAVQEARVFLPVVFTIVPGEKNTPPGGSVFEKHLLQAEVHGTGSIPGAKDVVLPLPDLVRAAAGLGHIQRTPDTDGVVRRVPLIFSIRGGFIPALSFLTALRHLDWDETSLHIERGRAIWFQTRSGKTITIPIDAQGRTWINFAGPWASRFQHYPYSWLSRVMTEPDGRMRFSKMFKDNFIVLGNLTTGSGDQGAIPFERDFPFSEIHLHILNMLLTQQFLRDATRLETWLSIIVPILLVTTASILGSPRLILPTFVAMVAGYLGILQYAFTKSGIVLPAVYPLFGLGLNLIFVLAVRFFLVDRERLRFLSVLGAVLPPHTIQEIQRSPKLISRLMEGRRREVSILFVDIQQFSTFCAKSDPLEIQRVLAEYRAAMTEILRSCGGTMEKYTGDEVMAFFGDAAPEGGGLDAEETRVRQNAVRAVRAGLEVQKKMQRLNLKWKEQGREEHFVRVGINTGPVTIGNLGTEQLWQYGIVGHEVNKGKRLETACEPGGLLLGRRTYALARKANIIPVDLTEKMIELKGIEEEAAYSISAKIASELVETVSDVDSGAME